MRLRAAGQCLILVLAPHIAHGQALNLVTGPPGSTAERLGEDLAAIGAECGFDLNVRSGDGAIDNLMAVRGRPRTQVGLVESDVLEFVATLRAENRDYRRASQGLRIVLPLSLAEVHVLARRDVATLDELEGRRVAAEDGSAVVTAGLMLDIAEVAPAEPVVPLEAEAALEALNGGEIDALVVVSGAPDTRFAAEGLAERGLHLVPIEDPVLSSLYTPVTIKAGTYPFAAEDVPTVAVRSVLVTYNFDRQQNSYQDASCEGVADLTHLALSRLDRLSAEGHPKWREVDVTDLPPDWQVSACALDALMPGYRFTCTKPGGAESVERGSQAAQARNALFLGAVCARIDCQ